MLDVAIMSYNIWFDITNREERLKSLIQIIRYHNPDIICLQEVTPVTSKYLISQLKDYQYIFPLNIETAYDCMIFSRYEILNHEEYEYDMTLMSRKLYSIIIKINGKKLAICTSHFESEFTKNNDIKISQYANAHEILNELSKEYSVIFCSDTNILHHEEKYFITKDKNWSDAWIQNGSDSNNEYTYDTKLNDNLKIRGIQKEIRSRIDRIIYKGDIILNNFKLIKNMCNQNIEASDHYGIMANLGLEN